MELKRKGVTLILLWQEYKEQFPTGYQLSQFCEKYRQWKLKLKASMRQVHRAGEKAFSDFAGTPLKVINPETGEVKSAYMFISALGASNNTFAEVFLDQSAESWCDGQAAAFRFWGGVPKAIVPDNAGGAVPKPCRYEPEFGAYGSMALHFGCVVLPARVAHPKDKAKAESAVQVVTRWIIARLRKRDFFSLEELRAAVRELLIDLNQRKFKRLPGTRQSAFEALDKPALKPLTTRAYEYYQIVKDMVGLDHHVEYEQHWYSAPHELINREVELRITANMVEILHGGNRVASHRRVRERDGLSTTEDEHRPAAHREYAQRSPEKVISAATNIGMSTARVIEMAFETCEHPEQAFKRAQGITRLSKLFGDERLEAACVRGLATGAVSYTSIKSILKAGLDKRPIPAEDKPKQIRSSHGNIRGAAYFATATTTEGGTEYAY